MSNLMSSDLVRTEVAFRTERDNRPEDVWARIEGRREGRVRRALWRRAVRTETVDN